MKRRPLVPKSGSATLKRGPIAGQGGPVVLKREPLVLKLCPAILKAKPVLQNSHLIRERLSGYDLSERKLVRILDAPGNRAAPQTPYAVPYPGRRGLSSDTAYL
jgi:hypothetical protein